MHDALLVGIGERLADLLDDGERVRGREAALAAPGGERNTRFRVAAEDPDGFPPGVAARSEHPDPHPVALPFNDAKKKPTGAVRSSGWWSVGLWYGLDRREPPPDGQASPASPRLSHGGSHAHRNDDDRGLAAPVKGRSDTR